MSFSHWLRSLKYRFVAASTKRNPRPNRRTAARRPALTLEVLEDRFAPATLTVNSIADTVSAAASTLDLREAIQLINTGGADFDGNGNRLSTAKASQINTSQPYGNNDTIVFASSLTGQTISLSNGELEIGTNVMITGLGSSNLTISDNNMSNAFTIDSNANATLQDLTITGTSGSTGTGIVNYGTLIVANVIVSNNNSEETGGGILNYNYATLTVTNSTFDNNSAGAGGGIGNYGTLTVTNSTFLTNSATSEGGGIFNEGTTTVSSSTFSTNAANRGGGISGNGTTTVSNSYFMGNTAADGGAAIDNNVIATVSNTVFSSNLAAFKGGAISNYGILDVTGSTLSNNSALGGGGIFSYDALTVANSTFSGNSATNSGGGLLNAYGTTVVTNSTFSGNSSTDGGGIFNYATLTVTNSTFASNSASYGGGISNFTSSAILNNTILANNSSGGDLYLPSGESAAFAGAHDLIGDGSYLNSFSSSMEGNPLLAPLGNYGGPTQTIALLPGSPAIDAGSNALAVDANGNPLSTDQRGGPSPIGSSVDIGAFESQGFTLAATNGNNQTTAPGSAFANPLTVRVTPNNSLEPVNGGVVSFTAPSSGASATLSASQATISSGVASVTAVASATGGSYTVAASTSGGPSTSFALTNVVPPAVLIVNTNADNTTADNSLSLREAILLVDNGGNAMAALGRSLTSGEASQISGVFGNNDTIEFSSALSGETITLGGTALEISTNVTLAGPGASNLGISGNGQSNVFTVASGVNATIQGVTILEGGSGSGGIDNYGILTVTNAALSDNSGFNGGGIANDGTLTVNNTDFSGNSAEGSSGGGAIDNRYDGTLTIINSIFTSNSAGGSGGALINYGTLSAINNTFTDNSANYDGGGISNGGTLIVTNATFSNNSSYRGGSIQNDGTMTVTNATFSDNSAIDGGGIENTGTLTITNTTFSDNSANYFGGGIDNFGTVTVTNNTFSGNGAGDDGGGLDNEVGTATVTNSTFSGNFAVYGGGIANDATLTVRNSIVAGNTAFGFGQDLFGDSLVANDSMIGNTSGASLTGTGNILNPSYLGLGSLGNYGGPTQTIPLLPGSPALDAGSDSLAVDANGNALTTDQRGDPRIVGPSVDMGAFESQGFTLSATGGSNQSASIGSTFATPLTVSVTANNALEPVNGGMVLFTAPGAGPSATLSANQAAISGGSASVTAVANSLGGSYTVTAVAFGANTLGSFALTNTTGPAVLIVNTNADNTTADNYLSLREAILLVNNYGNAMAALGRPLTSGEASQISGVFGNNDTIEFSSALSGQTITLSSGELFVLANVTITGLGASNLTIMGNGQSTDFYFDNPVNATIEGLTIAGGNGAGGGGIQNNGTLNHRARIYDT